MSHNQLPVLFLLTVNLDSILKSRDITLPAKVHIVTATVFPVVKYGSRSQEIPGVTGKFGLVVQNEAGQRLTEFCQESTLVK